MPFGIVCGPLLPACLHELRKQCSVPPSTKGAGMDFSKFNITVAREEVDGVMYWVGRVQEYPEFTVFEDTEDEARHEIKCLIQDMREGANCLVCGAACKQIEDVIPVLGGDGMMRPVPGKVNVCLACGAKGPA